jgi:hypothetical protein
LSCSVHTKIKYIERKNGHISNFVFNMQLKQINTQLVNIINFTIHQQSRIFLYHKISKKGNSMNHYNFFLGQAFLLLLLLYDYYMINYIWHDLQKKKK